MWREITYPFLNYSGAPLNVEDWEGKNNFIPHFNRYVITYPCGDQSKALLVKEAQPYQTITYHGKAWTMDIIWGRAVSFTTKPTSRRHDFVTVP